MIAVDTNILVYAHREDSTFFAVAGAALATLAESGRDWVIPWPCVHEFVAIVTHPRIYRPPTPLEQALAQVEAWIKCPTLRFITEQGSVYWPRFKEIVTSGVVSGPQIHDARIAAICSVHGIEEIWSADRDFSRFPGLNPTNPLLK
jgi:toxin-antitoxin system PIN domain toxin